MHSTGNRESLIVFHSLSFHFASAALFADSYSPKAPETITPAINRALPTKPFIHIFST